MRRSMKSSLGMFVLLLEFLLVFFMILLAYSLLNLSNGVVFGGGFLLLIVFIAAIRFLPKSSGYILGHVLQCLLFLSGFLIPVMFFVGFLFAICWFYALRLGERIDTERSLLSRY